jgi:ribosomal protein S12 methylthiotransferase accessory factor
MRSQHAPQIKALLQLVSPRVGLIRSLTRVVRGADEPVPPTLYFATLSNFDFKKAPAIERGSAGKGLTDSEAIGGAIGEAVERYCAAHVNLDGMRRTTLRDAPADAILPQDCVLYSETQYRQPGFPFVRPTSDIEIDWMRARELPSERDVWVPAVSVYMHGNNVMPGDALFAPTSNGLAAGPTVTAAIRSGLCELIERDAFVVTWLNKLPAPEVRLSSAGDALETILAHYARFGVELRIFNLTTDIGVPVMMAVALDRSGSGPAAVVGLGCHLTPQKAALRAAFEVCQVRPGEVRRRLELRGVKIPQRYEDVQTIEDHSAFFWDPARLDELGFLLEGSRMQELEELPSWNSASEDDALSHCVQALRAVGCRVAYVEITTPDLADYELHVVRTLATELQPIHFGNGLARLGGNRLYNMPVTLGDTRNTSLARELNPCPHPLA